MSYPLESYDKLFRKTLRYSFIFYFLMATLVTVIRIPLPEQADVRDLSERVAKLILEPPIVATPPVTPKITETPGEKTEEKPVKNEKPGGRSAQQNREIVKKSGLLASLIEEEEGGSLGAIIENRQMNQALSNIDLITTPSQKSSQPLIKKSFTHGSNLADKKISNLGTLKQGDRTKLAKGEGVTLSHLPGNSSGSGSGGRGDGQGSGMGIRLRGSGSGSGNGSIDYDAIARVVEQYKGGLIYLYNKELRTNPTLKGTITVEFSIDSSGKVIEAHVVSSTIDQASLEQALSSRIKMWKFPHLYNGIIVVTYPFVFFPV